MRQVTILTILFVISTISIAQIVTPTSGTDRLQAMEQRKVLEASSIVSNIKFRSIGPSVMSGRVVDIDVNPIDPTIFYVAYASGGLWKTTNNGITFEPLFDNEAVMTIGDIAVDWKHGEIIWVGTGENNSSRSSYSGTGIYKSTDGGKTWQNCRLEESHHIGRIVLHPDNPDIIWVAVLGHLYTPNKERGIYKTIDGGPSWKQTLYVNELTGAIDLVANPKNPNILYAALWQRERSAWNLTESGAGSGIYKSIDSGESWSILTTETSGFPTGAGVGRIGLAISEQNPEIIYAFLDNQFHRTASKVAETHPLLTKEQLRAMSKEQFLALDNGLLAGYLNDNGFPSKYTVESVKKMVTADQIKPIALVEYTEDANSMLFDTPIVGAQVYRTDNGGQSWQKTHEGFIDDVVYTYGYYFGQIGVSPVNSDHIYIMGVPILKSEDGGRNFRSINANNVHADHHALWINPSKPAHLINGNDGGVNISYDDGKNWINANMPPVGQFYSVCVDMAEPYNVYGGLQDNGVWYAASNYKADPVWYQTGRYPYQLLIGGDGMQVQVDTRDNNTIYTGFQFGNYYRINKSTNRFTYIQPKHELGERPLRFNWQTPIHLSIHNQDIIYMGSNRFHRSMNKGDNFTALSGDLTQGGKQGDVAFGTLTTIHESPLRFGLIYVGSDDGLVHVSHDGGYTWERITNNLPANLWVSRVQASQHSLSRVYLSLNNYRNDDFTAHIYTSDDYGKTWTRIGTDLPAEAVNVIKEDPANSDLLYVGTDHSLFISLNRGMSFMRMSNSLPAAPVHDLVVHPRDKELVVATHGRSLYVADVNHLQLLTPVILSKQLYIFDLESVTYDPNWAKNWSKWFELDEPVIKIPVYANANENATVRIKHGELVINEFNTPVYKGINYIEYDLSIAETNIKKYEKQLNQSVKAGDPLTVLTKADNGKFYIRPGDYRIEVIYQKQVFDKELVVVAGE